MKKIIKISLLLFFAFAILFLTYKIFVSLSIKENAQRKILKLPSDGSFKNLNQTIFSFSDIIPNRELIIVHFNSECDYCMNEISDIIKQSKLIQDKNVLLISSEKNEVLEKLYYEKNLNKYTFIKILRDDNHTFLNLFGTNAFPITLVYDKNLQLKKKYNGEASIDAIIK